MTVTKEKAIILSMHNGEQLVLKNETMSEKDFIINQVLERMPYCEIMEGTILTNRPAIVTTNKMEDIKDTTGKRVFTDATDYVNELTPDNSQYKDDSEWKPYTSNNRR